MFFLLSNTLDFFQGSGVLSKPKTTKRWVGGALMIEKTIISVIFLTLRLSIKENSAT